MFKKFHTVFYSFISLRPWLDSTKLRTSAKLIAIKCIVILSIETDENDENLLYKVKHTILADMFLDDQLERSILVVCVFFSMKSIASSKLKS